MTGFVIGFLAAMLGWQINLVGIHRGLERGRSAPLLVGLGATTADLLIILAVFTGAAPLLKHKPFWTAARWFGTATILFASFHILFHKTRFKDPRERKSRNPAESFMIGLLLVGGNPAIYLMWVGIMGFLITHLPGLHTDTFRIFFLLEFMVGSMSWFLFLAFFGLAHIRHWGEEKIHLISRLSAAFLLGAAIILFFEKF